MFGRAVFFGFVILPLIEIAGFVLVGQAIGLWPTLLAVLLGAVVGGALIRWQGFAVVARMRDALDGGQLPGRQLAEAALIGFAGLLLLVPGFFSDLIGLVLLVPFVRGAIYAAIASRMTVPTSTGFGSAPQGPGRLHGTVDLDADEYRDGPG